LGEGPRHRGGQTLKKKMESTEVPTNETPKGLNPGELGARGELEEERKGAYSTRFKNNYELGGKGAWAYTNKKAGLEGRQNS